MNLMIRPEFYRVHTCTAVQQGHNGVDQPHVVLMLDQFPKALGGGERVLLKLAELLPKYGFAVSIITFFIHPESDFSALCPSVPVYTLPLTSTVGVGAARAALGLAAFIKERRVRIVQTFFESSDLWGGLVTKVFCRAKLIWSRRDMGILRARKHSLVYRLLCSLPDHVFAVSAQVRRHCIEVDGLNAAKVSIVYNGLDVPSSLEFKNPGPNGGSIHIATVGNIRPIKGHDVLVRAAAQMLAKFPSARFTLAGNVLDENYYKQLRQMVEALNISDRFRFVGGVQDVNKFLQSVDIFVLPSRSEGFSNSIIEAMAASIPVVATDVGGNAEAIQHGDSGLIVPADDDQALAAALLLLCEDRSFATRLGMAARRRVDECFTTSIMLTRTVNVYRGLLAGPSE